MDLSENQLSKIVLDSVFKIYFELGPGLLESVYERILAIELREMGLEVDTQVPIPVFWNNQEVGLDWAFEPILLSKRNY